MNERIRKLAEQAGATINEGFDGNKDFVYGITMSPEECEKFAELIVRECARVADQWVDDEDNGRNLVSAKLKQHFGVEKCMN